MDYLIYLYIAILLFAALLSTRLMKKLKLPNVTGYIITGIIMGPFVFGLLFNKFDFNAVKDGPIYQIINGSESDPGIKWVSSIALGFIAFTIGTSFKTSTLKAVGSKVLTITCLEAFGASLFVSLTFIIAHFIAPDTISLEIALTLGAIGSATAPAATLMVIKQYRAKGELVNTLLPVVALDDAAALILFAILFQIANSISSGSFSAYDMLAKPIIEIVISISIGAILGLIISYFNRFFKSRNNKIILAIFVVFSAVGLYILFQQDFMAKFELSSLLTCMMAGAIYCNSAKDNGPVLDQLDRFTYPIYMMFFVISGASLDLSIFAGDNGLVVVLIAVIYILVRVAGKYCGALAGTTISHSSPNVKKYLGLTLIPQAGVAIGLATSANALFSDRGKPEIGAMILATILTSTLVYELVGPLIAKFALKKAGEITEE